MVLLELAQILKITLELDRASGGCSVRPTGQTRHGLSWIWWFGDVFTSRLTTSLLQAVQARLGNSPECLNKVALIYQCAEAARRCSGLRQPSLAELISTSLGFFMSHTVPHRTRGLIYSAERHPLLRLFEGDRLFTIAGAQIPLAALHPARVGISTVIAVVREGRNEEVLRAGILGPLTHCIAESGLDVMIVGSTPELAASVANAVPGSGRCRAVDFPMVESRLRLRGISLRCFSQR